MSPSVLALSSVSVSAAAWSQRRRSTLTVIGLVLMLAIEIPIIRCFQQQQYRYRQSSSRTFRPCRSSPSSSFIAFRNTETTKDARVPGYSKTSSKIILASSSSLSSSSSMQPTIHQPPQTQYATYLVTCVPGLAHIVQRELEDIRQMMTTTKKKEKNPAEEVMEEEEEYAIVDIAVSGNAGVTFEATREGSLYVLCWLRSGHRLLELVAATTTDVEASSLLTSRHDLSTFIRNAVNVKDLLGDGQGGMLTVSVKAILNNPRDLPKDLSHSHYTALTIKNALCDVVRELRQGDRPTVDVDNPDVPLVAILRGVNFYQNYHQDYNNNNNGYAEDHNDEGAASISLYRSLHPPGSLHKRGYRSGSAIHKAAMKESMAAGLLIEAGWKDKVDSVMANYQQRRKNHNKNNDHDDDAEEPQQQQQQRLKLIDPMAGSGSLVIEAAMLASNISPGLMRIRCGVPNHLHPPVTRWKTPLLPDTTTNYDVAAAWKTVLLDATERAKEGMRILKQDPSLIQIVGNDIYPPAVDVFEESLRSAGLLNLVELSNKDCYDLDATSTTTSTLADENSDHDTNNVDYVVATNPPWGVRLTEDIDASWEGLRHFIRDNCPAGTKVFILSGDKSATATLKLRRDRMIPLQTGEQNLRWIQYTIGRKRQTTEQKMELRRTKDGADNDNGGNPDTDTDDRWQQQRRHQPSPTKKSYTPTNKFNTNTNAENKNKSKRSPQGRGNQQQNAGSSLKEDSWV